MASVELSDVGIFAAMRRYGDMCIHTVLDLRRTFSRQELEQAVAATFADFPVLAQRYEPGFWRDRWVPVPGPSSDAVFVEETDDVEATTGAWLRRTLVATRERQLRLVALRHGGRTRLILSLLHLAVDGAGIAAVGHVLGAHLYGVAPSLPIEPRREIWRALEGLRWYQAPVLARDLAKLVVQPLQQRAAARRERAYRADSAAAASYRQIVISPAELVQIRSQCPKAASINDALIAGLARVAANRSRHGPVVITYTMDLRRYGRSARLMASNSSALLWASVSRQALTDLASAAGEVAALTKRQRGSLAGPALLLGPYLFGSGLPHAVARGLVHVLAPVFVDLPMRRGLLMTNVGRLDDGLLAFGDDIEAIRIVGPTLEAFPVPLIVAFGFRGALHLELFAAPGLGCGVLDELERELLAALELDR